MPKEKQIGWREEFIEKGAEIEHNRWARWQKYVHSKCTIFREHETDMPHCWCNPDKTAHPNGNMSIIHKEHHELVIPLWAVEGWERQIKTPYVELSEKEKESDRREVREYLPLLDSLEQKIYREILEIVGKDDMELENSFTEEEREFVIETFGVKAVETPEFLRERRYGGNLERARLRAFILSKLNDK